MGKMRASRRSAGRHAGTTRPSAERSEGFATLELVVAFGILLIALLAFSRSLVSSTVLTSTSREGTLASEGARRMLEELAGAPFRNVFALYNAEPDDDPDGPGTAPGNGFSIRGLDPRDDDPDGLVGEIVFPNVREVPGELREDLEIEELGVPRDLDGDDFVDGFDHSDDYILLPVLVIVEWKGSSGDGKFRLKTFLADR
jgi:hypothetical protein